MVRTNRYAMLNRALFARYSSNRLYYQSVTARFMTLYKSGWQVQFKYNVEFESRQEYCK